MILTPLTIALAVLTHKVSASYYDFCPGYRYSYDPTQPGPFPAQQVGISREECHAFMEFRGARSMSWTKDGYLVVKPKPFPDEHLDLCQVGTGSDPVDRYDKTRIVDTFVAYRRSTFSPNRPMHPPKVACILANEHSLGKCRIGQEFYNFNGTCLPYVKGDSDCTTDNPQAEMNFNGVGCRCRFDENNSTQPTFPCECKEGYRYEGGFARKCVQV